MTMSKEEREERLHKAERDLEKIIEEKRLEWLQQICKEARHYNFKSLGELIAWIVDHASDISSVENKPSAATS